MPAVTPVPPAVVVGFIHGDPVDPGLEAALGSKRPDFPEDLQEDFLHHVAGFTRVFQQAADEIVHRLFKPLNQRFVSGFVALSQPLDQELLILVISANSLWKPGGLLFRRRV
jgi:hypothetical protein